MKLEDQVCSLEQAKYFQEKGLKLRSAFFWVEYFDQRQTTYGQQSKVVDETTFDMYYQYNRWFKNVLRYPAYNGTELGEMLPLHYHSYRLHPDADGELSGKRWWCLFDEYGDDDYDKRCAECMAPKVHKFFNTASLTEAQARAAMLQHLVENNLWQLPGKEVAT